MIGGASLNRQRWISVLNQDFLAEGTCRHLEISMTVRTSRKSVTFTRPFSTGIDEVQLAGTYTVETDEELLPGCRFLPTGALRP